MPATELHTFPSPTRNGITFRYRWRGGDSSGPAYIAEITKSVEMNYVRRQNAETSETRTRRIAGVAFFRGDPTPETPEFFSRRAPRRIAIPGVTPLVPEIHDGIKDLDGRYGIGVFVPHVSGS